MDDTKTPVRALRSAVLLAVGSELTTGETRDTNSGELARSMAEAGVDVEWISALPDRLGIVTTALNGALAMLVRKPDLKTLDAALRKAKARVEKNYTADSWAAADLPDAIASAAAVRADPNAAQAQVDEQTAALLEAMAKLVRK